jgi:hypothetical protein
MPFSGYSYCSMAVSTTAYSFTLLGLLPIVPLVQWQRLLALKETEQNRCLLTHLSTETEPVPKMPCSLVFRIPDNGQSSET